MTTLRAHYETQVLHPCADVNDIEVQGPEVCRVCGELLANKEPQLSMDGRSPHSGADYTGYIVQSHHSDEAGGAVCTDCAEQEDAGKDEEDGAAWLAIARWVEADPDARSVHFGRNGIQLQDVRTGMIPTFVNADSGRLDPGKALGFVMRDECPKTERNV